MQVRKEKKGALNNSRTRAAKATAQEEYTEANRAVKNNVKTDKANFIEELAKETEDAAAQGQGNMKQLYEITRKLAGKFKRTDRPIKDKNGNVKSSMCSERTTHLGFKYYALFVRMYITSQQSYLSQINTRQTGFEACHDSKRKSRDCSAP